MMGAGTVLAGMRLARIRRRDVLRAAGSRRVTEHVRVVEIDDHRLTLSNSDKVLWPDEGHTKADLVQYYVNVADRILPFLRDRPLSLLRCPDGVTGECFYQKHAPPGVPPWIPTKRVRSEHAA